MKLNLKKSIGKSDFVVSNNYFRNFCDLQTNSYARHYKYLHNYFSEIPETFIWQFDTESTLSTLTEESTLEDANQHIQEVLDSLVNDMRAAVIGLVWKCEELTASSVRAINQNFIVSSAITTRAALEAAIACWALTIRFMTAVSRSQETWNVFSMMESIEAETKKLLWGRKYLDRDPVVSSSNIRNYFNTVLTTHKNEKGNNDDVVKNLDSVYEFLSNAAHPNAEGQQLFWNLSFDQHIDLALPEWREMSKHNRAPADLMDKYIFSIAWALSFAAERCAVSWKYIETFHFSEGKFETKENYQRYKQELFQNRKDEK